MFACAMAWELSPSEFWNMTPVEWWAVYYWHDDRQRDPVSKLTKDESADLYEWAMARKEALENGAT